MAPLRDASAVAGHTGGLSARMSERRTARVASSDGSSDGDARTALWLMAPALALYAVFTLLPIAATFWLSFNSSAGFNHLRQFRRFRQLRKGGT
ncbi:hypothetical protein U8P76_25580 (plasmid) [Rhizobium johnstonii]|nr:hypothetical protein U8P76_25580 [Rhizobium johnstonii]